ncbi:uncharacterized protein F4812DRAFT_183491 [Daldinia caldariorum]|uniref:uncharacterized protein n=1 Tax=Daldinia caldariorum TaxID=326644 RepID=UPI00200791BB|nr:uncharacterized protein F4812DRAFT_183491 [Daldinia caldariorum]KAI1471550.1 hypothetical protein F4812DRAFT_183491 [Daldinia caldariorum]
MFSIEMMLTAKQPVQHGYRPVHDLPTPPRSSPPLSVQDSLQKSFVALPQKQSPSTKPMSAPHRGLPLPAAMTLAQPPPPPPAPGPPHPPAPGPPLHSQGVPAPSPHSQALGALPAPPQHQGSEEAMRSWLIAKTEEEKRKQEEEKTRQETLRLEQRKLEYDMLRTSLDRGIPPPMIPIVFAGMSSGTLSQAALEWAQQYLMPQQAHAAQIMPVQGALSPEARRESQQYGGQQYGVPSTPGSVAGAQASFVPYQGPSSPRHRAHTLSMGGAVGRPLGSSALPRLSTGEGASGPAGIPHPAHALAQQQQPQQDTQSPSIYFHHWQPPNTQGGSNQPGTPSVESPKKRKATGPQQAPPPPSQARFRSPPFGQHSGSSALSNPPPGRRRGHSRQRSDVSAYRSTGRGRIEPFGPHRGLSPGLGPSRETGVGEVSQSSRSGAHSVSSLLADQPSPRYASEMRPHQSEGERRNSPATSDERSRGGATGVGSGGAGREND